MLSEELQLMSSISVRQSECEGTSQSTSKQSLSLMVREESSPGDLPLRKPLDLQRTDFIGPADVLKSIFSLHQPQEQAPVVSQDDKSSRQRQKQRQREQEKRARTQIKGEIFAIHKLGHAIILDSIPECDPTVFESNGSENVTSRQFRPLSNQHLNAISMNDTALGGGFQRDDRAGLAVVLNSSAEALLAVAGTSAGAASSSDASPRMSPVPFIPNNYDSSLSLIVDDDESQLLQEGSPHTPPPAYFMPSYPSPGKRTLDWRLSDLQMVLTSDHVVYHTEKFSAGISLKAIDTTHQLERATCLDMYLDNVIDNIPELALCLHARGFVRRVHVVHTNEIPWLNTSLLPSQHASETSSGGSFEPIFDPKLIEMNALAILRFLKESCTEDGTYLLRRSSDGEFLHLYDLSNASLLQQQKFKYFIAMVSYRFAVRLGQFMQSATPQSKSHMRMRQRKLFDSCFQLLGQIREMGGESHESIRAAVMEQLADTSLARIDMHKTQSAGGIESCDEEFNLVADLSDARELLQRAVDCLQVAYTEVQRNNREEKEIKTEQTTDSKVLIVGDVRIELEDACIAENSDINDEDGACDEDDENGSDQEPVVEILLLQVCQTIS
jgi:hypothetical protein